MDQAAVGIDLGGSFIKGILTNSSGQTLGWETIPTEREQGVEHVLERIEHLVTSLSGRDKAGGQGKPLWGVGIGIPGMLDVPRKRVVLAPNLDWRNVELKDSLERRLGLPVFLENDANAAALGEAWLGGARNSRSFMLVTIGTGIGSGLVLDGKIFKGDNGLAAELGHMTIMPGGPVCSCGKRGCLETLVSATAILKLAQERGVVPKGAQAKDVLELAHQGSKEAVAVVSQAMEYLAVGLKNTVVLLDLQLILIGGGIGDSAGVFIERLRENTLNLLPVRRKVEIVRASLGNRAGALGGARLAFLERG